MFRVQNKNYIAQTFEKLKGQGNWQTIIPRTN